LCSVLKKQPKHNPRPRQTWTLDWQCLVIHWVNIFLTQVDG
jgi:hypothetical protein